MVLFQPRFKFKPKHVSTRVLEKATLEKALEKAIFRKVMPVVKVLDIRSDGANRWQTQPKTRKQPSK